MKRLFFLGVVLLAVFEAATVYFIMPLPGSQRMHSIDFAYFLYSSRWIIRALCLALILAGLVPAWRVGGWRRAFVPASLVVVGIVAYACNFVMSADRIFIAPKTISMQPAERNTVEKARLVVGLEINGDARAYPVEFIGYHHQVRDVVGGTPVIVTYCTVCRTARVLSPIVNGKIESFRLVGMDHFNAMFEDSSTHSWWRQATGQAIAGPLKGSALGELPSRQATLAEWLELHPTSLIMQADSDLRSHYSTSYAYESGSSRSPLTGTDTVSWRDKAWVVGVALNGKAKAYDWNRLVREGVVNDQVGGTPIVLALAADRSSFFAFERPDSATRFTVRGDSLVAAKADYALSGKGRSGTLKPVFASQEFWHSWRTFHPETSTY